MNLRSTSSLLSETKRWWSLPQSLRSIPQQLPVTTSLEGGFLPQNSAKIHLKPLKLFFQLLECPSIRRNQEFMVFTNQGFSLFFSLKEVLVPLTSKGCCVCPFRLHSGLPKLGPKMTQPWTFVGTENQQLPWVIQKQPLINKWWISKMTVSQNQTLRIKPLGKTTPIQW